MLGRRTNKVLLLKSTERTNIQPVVLVVVADDTTAGVEAGCVVTTTLRATPIAVGYQPNTSSNSA